MPPSPTTVPGASEPSSPPITTRPSIGSSPSVRAMPEVAASSAACSSSRPSQRAAASAARSVVRANDSQMHGSRRSTSPCSTGWSTVSVTRAPAASAAAASTSSITAPVASSTLAFDDHRSARLLRALDDVVLQTPDVVRERLEVLRHRPEPVRGRVADPEVRRVLVLVVDRENAVHDDRVVPVDREHPRHEVHALEHHRPALLERALDRRVDGDEHVGRLLHEAVDHRRRRRRRRSSSGGSTACTPARRTRAASAARCRLR